MGSYERVIVELVVYVDKDDYIHRGKSAKEIVENELEIIESGIFIERFISEEEIIENEEEK